MMRTLQSCLLLCFLLFVMHAYQGKADEPSLEAAVSQSATGCNVEWLYGSEKFPPSYDNALQAGTDDDGSMLYICRGQSPGSDGKRPGLMQKGWAGCQIAYGSTSYWANPFEVFACSSTVAKNGSDPKQVLRPYNSCNVAWLPGNTKFPPSYDNALQVGADDDGSPLYACLGQSEHQVGMRPGVMQKGWAVCSIAYGSGNYGAALYEVLICSPANNKTDVAAFQV
eukprot:gnl/TRDRNA2_/TRDRNA2_197771_c0_seq1.p1 gnl/TRDRNA2_/TRDRNA2_197771_c0~~gnl/TRDRNA2_/TRDRNA2_197771_c0_seq1.p1  ORF type:complete len:225 (+),score=20.34 gnl/TRDRNA2_/TRDRNA2_197771_c0_seq1:102-776(+)